MNALFALLVLVISLSILSYAGLSTSVARAQFAPLQPPQWGFQARVLSFSQQSATYDLSMSYSGYPPFPPAYEIGTVELYTRTQAYSLCSGSSGNVSGYYPNPFAMPNWQQTGGALWTTSATFWTNLFQNVSADEYPSENYSVLYYIATNSSVVPQFDPTVQVGLNHYAGDLVQCGSFLKFLISLHLRDAGRNDTYIYPFRLSVSMIQTDRELVSFLMQVPYALIFLVGVLFGAMAALTINAGFRLRMGKFRDYLQGTSVQIGVGVLVFIPFFLLALGGYSPPTVSNRYELAVQATEFVFGAVIVLLVYSLLIPVFPSLGFSLRRRWEWYRRRRHPRVA